MEALEEAREKDGKLAIMNMSVHQPSLHGVS
jgi:hypothetical protein